MKIYKTVELGITKNRLKTPVSLILLVTAKCNLKCGFCYFQEGLNKPKNELTLGEYKKLSESLGNLIRLIVSGGEPYLRKDLPKICETFYENNNVEDIVIPTNGFLPLKIRDTTKEILTTCNKSNVMVSLSLDGTEKLHDCIRGVKGSFKNVVETYHRLSELKKAFPTFRVHVTTTVSKENYQNMEELADFIKLNMPELNGHNFELVRDKNGGFSKNLPPLNECIHIQKIHERIINGYKHHFPQSRIKSLLATLISDYKFNLYLEILKQKKQILPCYAGNIIGVVNETGDVFLCELLDKVGNLREASFQAIWDSKEANLQRGFIKNKKCFCTHSCFQGTNVLYNPFVYPDIIKYGLKRSFLGKQ